MNFKDKFKEETSLTESLKIAGWISLIGLVILIGYLSIYWLPSYFAPEQCEVVPSIGSVLFKYILTCAGILTGMFLIHVTAVYSDYKKELKRQKVRDSYVNLSYEEREAKEQEQDKKDMENLIRKGKREKVFNIIFWSIIALMILSTLIGTAFTNYYCL